VREIRDADTILHSGIYVAVVFQLLARQVLVNTKSMKAVAAVLVVAVILAVMIVKLQDKIQLFQDSSALKALAAALTSELQTRENFASQFEHVGEYFELKGRAYNNWIKEMRLAGQLDPTGNAGLDRWGNKYHLRVLMTRDGRAILSVVSDGPDKISDTTDDIIEEGTIDPSSFEPAK